ncbi:MAG: TIGR02530 family flagellar biosynthesis protein [bacterium]
MNYNINNFNSATTKSTNISNDINNLNNNTGNSFQQILENNNTNKVIFSKHATMRLNDRNINLSSSQLERLESGVQTAQKKGIKDSLVLVDNVALLVNIKNKTVVTAMDNSNSNNNNNNNNLNNKEQVYTNIDGAVIV